MLTLVMTVCPPCCLTKSVTGPEGAFSRVLPPAMAVTLCARIDGCSWPLTDELGDSRVIVSGHDCRNETSGRRGGGERGRKTDGAVKSCTRRLPDTLHPQHIGHYVMKLWGFRGKCTIGASFQRLQSSTPSFGFGPHPLLPQADVQTRRGGR